MRRRSFITSVAAAASVAAGCARPVDSGGSAKRTPPKIDQQTPTSRLVPSLPTTEIKSVATAGITSAPTSVTGLEAFGRALRDRDVAVASVTDHGTFLSMDQSIESFGETGLAQPLGVVAGVYAALVDDAEDPKPLSVTVTYEGSTVGEYAIAEAWAMEYLAGETTAREYAEKVLNTVKTKT